MTDSRNKLLKATVEPRRVCIVTPSHDRMVPCEYAGALMASMGFFGGMSFVLGNSNVALARNVQAGQFLSTQFEWLLSIDADISWSLADLKLLYEGDELIRCAEYAKKDFKLKNPAQFGMGFCLIHREAFERIRSLRHEETQAPLVGDFFWQGNLMSDFFPTGPDLGGHWLGEDHGFFRLAKLAEISTRRETRTKLIHWGRHGYEYTPEHIETSTALPDSPA